jgi:DNA repair photolyase
MKNKQYLYGTREWAVCNANYISGCKNNCKYCFGKETAIRYKRKTAKNWTEEVVNEKNLYKKFGKKDGYIMFPSSHDISPENIEFSLIFLSNLLRSGNQVLIVTKAHLSVIVKICETFADFKNQILFRITIGSTNSETLRFWEPNAPPYEERLEELKYAYYQSFQTNVSAEPALDVNTQELIDELLPYITDAIWVGKPNALLKRIKMNEADDEETLQRARELIANQDEEWLLELFENNWENSKIKWKESIRKILNIENNEITELD